MIVGLDFFGVIANHLVKKAVFARTEWGLPISENEATREALVERLGKEEYRRFVLACEAQPVKRPLEHPLYEDVYDTLHALAKEGDRFVLVSMQPSLAWQAILEQYLTHHKLPIGVVGVVITDEEKRGMCTRHGVQLFLDDNRSVLELLRPTGMTLVWANFYHRPEGGWNEPVAHSWREFADIVRAARHKEGE